LKLFSPITINQTKIRNRVVMAPMCQYQATADGHAAPWHHIHYASRAVGGVGLIIVEAVGIEARGRLSGRCLGIYEEGHREGLEQIAVLGRSHGAVMGIQLSHGGRKGYSDRPVAPSAITPDPNRFPVPHKLSPAEIGGVVEAWKVAARRARDAGYDMIQLHGAHGYLIHSFLSPLSNVREDSYGGTPENRRRFLMEVLAAVQEEWPRDRLLSVRLSAVDHLEGGLTMAETKATVEELKKHNVDVIDISSGGLLQANIAVYPGYQVHLAEAVKKAVGLPTIAVGGLDEPALAESVVAGGRADFAALGRALLRDPHWVLRAAEYDQSVAWPESYERGRRSR